MVISTQLRVIQRLLCTRATSLPRSKPRGRSSRHPSSSWPYYLSLGVGLALGLWFSPSLDPVQAQETPPAEDPGPNQSEPKPWESLLAPAAPRTVTITVGTYQQRPFVFWDDTQTYGYSIDIWQEVATGMDVKTQFVKYDGVTSLLEALEAGEVDVGLSGISITAAREGTFDFSYPIYSSGLQLLIRNERQNPLVALAIDLGGWQSAWAILRLLLLSLMIGVAVWLLERPQNQDFPRTPLKGIGQGIWFAFVTLGTFGYGDVTPRSFWGRCVACIWMAFSFFVLADFVATMTAVRQNQIQGTTIADLKGEKVGALENTSAYYYIRNQAVVAEGFPSFKDAVDALGRGEIEGVVGDYPTVKYVALENDNVTLSGDLLDHESYGIVTAEGNEVLMEAIDRELLKLERSERLEQLKTSWFPPE